MSHSVNRAGRPGFATVGSSAAMRSPRPFGSLEEMSLCHPTSHRNERFAEMVMTDPHDPEFPESEMDRHNFERVM